MDLSSSLNKLFEVSTIERLNRLLVDVLQDNTINTDHLQFIQTLLSRYVTHGRPLTGYFIICCVTELQWTLLAQCVFPPALPSRTDSVQAGEAEAASRAWSAMLQGAVPQDVEGDDILDALRTSTQLAMNTFTELLSQIEDMETEPAADTYAWETMSESLVSHVIVVKSMTNIDK